MSMSNLKEGLYTLQGGAERVDVTPHLDVTPLMQMIMFEHG